MKSPEQQFISPIDTVAQEAGKGLGVGTLVVGAVIGPATKKAAGVGLNAVKESQTISKLLALLEGEHYYGR